MMDWKNIWVPVIIMAIGAGLSVAAQAYLGKGWIGVLLSSLAAMCTTIYQEIKQSNNTSVRVKRKTRFLFGQK
jgi:hypothetical protein